MHATLVRTFLGLPVQLRRTLTWDQDTEMARHLDVTATTGLRLYSAMRPAHGSEGASLPGRVI